VHIDLTPKLSNANGVTCMFFIYYRILCDQLDLASGKFLFFLAISLSR